MTTKTYKGGCHCGDVRYEVDLDLSEGGGRCNCSICSKSRNWSMSVKPEAFRLLTDEGNAGDYQFGSNSVHWRFCKRCGIHAYGSGDIPEMGGAFKSVRLTCLDGVSAEELAAMPVRFSDGKNNNWMHEPSDAEKKYL